MMAYLLFHQREYMHEESSIKNFHAASLKMTYCLRLFYVMLLGQLGCFMREGSYDVPCYINRSATMYIRSKLIRFGYKLWVLTSDSSGCDESPAPPNFGDRRPPPPIFC